MAIGGVPKSILLRLAIIDDPTIETADSVPQFVTGVSIASRPDPTHRAGRPNWQFARHWADMNSRTTKITSKITSTAMSAASRGWRFTYRHVRPVQPTRRARIGSLRK